MSHYQPNPVLIQYLINQIEQSDSSCIPFSQFMGTCLYHATDGYYMSERPKIGRNGDFYTSSNIGSIMAEMLAVYVERRTRERGWDADSITLVEWGAGTGRLALQMSQRLKYDRFEGYKHVIVERSPHHQRLVSELLGGERVPITWWDEQVFEQEAPTRRLFVVANELLDAFPVERIRHHDGRYEQCYVKWDEEKEQFMPLWLPATEDILLWLEEHEIQLVDQQIFDAGIAMTAWMTSILSQVGEAEFIFIDYGDGTNELTAAHRMEGTLMCYHRHQAHDNPWIHIGEQDITSMVDFDICQRVAKQVNAAIIGYMTQKSFLLEQGLLNELQQHTNPDPFSAEARRNRAIRQLLLSDQMSERFHVLLLSCGSEPEIGIL
ncbi:SAM-dependent methyltransferase [Paenibacillus sp. chi10]|uniref:SAM-dependent methyltransferase n=1 Tax=Paenibacillus suaedae TaxID=3077233 RepID=A0AAJ2JUL3_9BACL|nr:MULTISPECIES: SAM-dependent methyltransferase [unclassified Paenibacillus]MDT8976976.1 SAM-dependent methyltransferase [Paenibacillus sp. chi10]GAV12247.1 hypothetical protein PBN151_2180 [Paenibacillus sp. NAIST15-1]